MQWLRTLWLALKHEWNAPLYTGPDDDEDDTTAW